MSYFILLKQRVTVMLRYLFDIINNVAFTFNGNLTKVNRYIVTVESN